MVASRTLALGILLWLSVTPDNSAGQDFAAVCDDDDFVTGSFGNLVVPPGGQCKLLDAVINGNIRAEEGAILGLLGGVIVTGNIAVYGGTSINILTNQVTPAMSLLVTSRPSERGHRQPSAAPP